MTLAWSAGSAMRRSGVASIARRLVFLAAAAPNAGGCARSASGSGAIALMLMPYGPSSKASLLVKAMMPPLAAA